MTMGSVFEVHYRMQREHGNGEPEKQRVAAETQEAAVIALTMVRDRPDAAVDIISAHQIFSDVLIAGEVDEDPAEDPIDEFNRLYPSSFLVALQSGETTMVEALKAGDVLVDGFAVSEISGPDVDGDYRVIVALPKAVNEASSSLEM